MRDEDALSRLIDLLARLPGLGPRSARRAALYLIKRREAVLEPLSRAMADVVREAGPCGLCGAATTGARCTVCRDPRRDPATLCVVEDTGDVWALERAGAFRGRYHVLGGALSALEGVGPDDLRIPQLMTRVGDGSIREVVLALNATVEGQTTAHYIADQLGELGIAATSLARGVPIGGELDYLDEGTLTAAFQARKPF